ncbi:hypothetical protein BOTBODRAFT_68286 [Botryobasidium botryosum FD-172 SS1]|uniref:FAD dependent oxidoreductase domain-containing protein n=1 Tax=Botryobasidium botryosum (strain FD-172 SS1) TaxID=930990 RepID=A0A067M5Y9_BOTB1|nr:hypothetical protein BOTBODRAFT_68286 [Botryobasidium botryosum FD-172 SS1]
MLDSYHVVVVGGGPIGLATAYECAKAGQKVLLLEQSMFFNQSGSSGDLVRMFRTAYTEKFMAKLAVKAMPLWDDLEKLVGPLRLMTGLLNFGDPHYGEGGPEGTLLGPIPNLDEHHMKYTKLTRDEIQAQLPFQNLPDEWIGLDMVDNGCINVSKLLRELFTQCEKLGVDLEQYATVKKIYPDPSNSSRWRVAGLLGSEKGTSAQPEQFDIGASKIAITAGAYTNHILRPSFNFGFDLDIWEMVSAYYAIDPSVSFPKMWFQFMKDTKVDARGSGASPGAISNLFYGFPSVPWGPPNLVRIAVDAAKNMIKDPDERLPKRISPEDLENTRQFVKNHVRGAGLDPLPVFAGTCLQTNVYDNMFVLDYIPEKYLPGAGPERAKTIAVFTAGWAMKFVPLIGKVMKELLVDGATSYDISHFEMTRTDGDHSVIQTDFKLQQQVASRSVGSSMRS